MSRFFDLLERSVIGQVAIAIMVIGTMCVLWAQGNAVPSELYALGLLVFGFWGGSKAQHAIDTRERKGR